MSRPQVSVIIPAFNCASWIRETVDSVLVQSCPPHEIVVVDDGSSDSTSAVLAEYGEKLRYVRQENHGVAAARNTGLDLASGEFIAFLDADDVWHPRKLELQLRVIENRRDIGLLGTSRFTWPAKMMPAWTDGALPSFVPIYRNHLVVKNRLTASSVVIRREVARAVGHFDVTLNGPEDHDYWVRAADITNAAILAVPLTGYRSVPASLSKCAVPMETGMRKILQKLDECDYWRGDRLLRRRAYGYAHYACAYMHGAAGKQLPAISRILHSLAWYPLPFHRSETGASFGRLRRLVVALLRLLGAVNSEPVL